MSNSEAQSWMVLFALIVAVVVVFLILREFFCWYWKINERVRLETRQVNLTIMLIKELKRGKTTEGAPDEVDDLLKEEIEPR
jgi:hypothetical protein